jgi:hypothetical protein
LSTWSCQFLLDAGTLTSYLTTVNTWAAANPTEVLSILIVNIDNVNASTVAESYTSSGLDSISYAPEKATLSQSEWPTLGSMIDSGKRVVTFMDKCVFGAGTASLEHRLTEIGPRLAARPTLRPCPTSSTSLPTSLKVSLLGAYSCRRSVDLIRPLPCAHRLADAYNVVENSFPCTANRSTGDPSTQLMLTNHYLDVVRHSLRHSSAAFQSLTGFGSARLCADGCNDRVPHA